jgi:CRISPR-associated protein Cas1
MSVVYVSEQGAYLRKRGGRFVVTRKDEEIFSIPEAALDELVLLGNVQISTQAMSELMANGIEVVFLSLNGKFKGLLEPGNNKNVFKRLAQYEAALNEERCFEFAKWFVSSKIKDELNMLERWGRRGLLETHMELKTELSRQLELLDTKSDHAGARGAEGVSAKLYFSAFRELVPPPFEWNGRNRQPPRDPVNALLSLTYMMTLSRIISKVHIHAFDPFIGFLHQLDYGRPSFALDVLEPLRAGYCDRFVISLVQQETFHPDDFSHDDNKGCRLLPEPFKRYLNAFQKFSKAKTRNISSMDKKITILLEQFGNALQTGKMEI